MANLENQSKKRYYPLRDAENPYKVPLVEITEAQYRALYPEIWATQKREQYHHRCTPEATYDLRKGMAGAREHSPEDFITKITSVSPSQKVMQIWLDSLNLIFQHNQELIDYVQMICGLAAIGKVYVEALIIAYGDGRNGKSTFWNAISRVLGLYSGNISADTLTVGCRRNIKPEMAEVKGKRLLIAAEMQEGARLNDSTVKQLCSTDDVFAEKPLFQKISSYECRKNWYAGEYSRPAPMAKSAVTAATTASLRLLFAVSVVKCSAESTGTTVAANPSSGAALAGWNLPVKNVMQEPSMKRY